MKRDKNRKKRPLRRLRRLLILLVVAFMAYSVVGGYAPFMRLPEAPDAEAVAASVEPMLHDVDTADRATILETSTAALDERIRMMAQARREIVITTYECHDGESTRDLLAVACHMAEAGVRVRFLADGIAGRLDIAGNDCFRAAAALDNVEIRFYNYPNLLTPWKTMGRMHDKYVIVDDLAFILGGRNMYDGFLGDYPTRRHRSLDREALVYNVAGDADSVIYRLKSYFEGLWSQEETSVYSPKPLPEARRSVLLEDLEARYRDIVADRPDLFEPVDYESMTLPTRGAWLLSNPSTIYAKEPTLFAQLTALMATAEDDVTIHSPYAVLNGFMRDALAEITGRVPVTLMVNAVENGANLVGSGDYLYHKGDVLSTGVNVLEYAGGKSYHGKAVAIDGDLSIIGSFNLDLRSAYVDTELMLVIRGAEVNAQLRQHLDALHADCRRVIDEATAETPEGLTIPPLPLWKRVALRAIGLLVQPVRNLV